MTLPCRLKESFSAAARKAALAALTALAVAACGTTSSVSREKAEEQAPLPVNDAPAQPPETDSYEETLFEVNFRKATGGRTAAGASPHSRISLYMESFCFKPSSPAQFADHYRQSWTKYPEVAGLTLFGAPLAGHAHALGVHYCDLEQLPPGIGGQFLPVLRAIVLPKTAANDLSLPLTLGHEVMHAAQHRNGELNYARNWDTSSRISRTLATEAAALTMEFMIAYEAKEAGNPKLWDYLQNRFDNAYADKRIYTALPEAHKAALARGEAPDAALKLAAKEVFHLVLENREWRRFYLDFELRNYLADVTSGLLDRENVHPLQYGQERIDRVGLIGAAPSFTQGARLPDIRDILASEPKIKWAFEVVELGRFERMLGASDPAVAELRAKAVLGGNPYVGLSLDVLQGNVDGGGFTQTAGKKFLYVHEHLDAMLKPRLAETPGPRKPELPI